MSILSKTTVGLTAVLMFNLVNSSIHAQTIFFDHVIKDNYTWTMTVITGDMNNDSLVDIVGGAYYNDTIFWWENNGGLNFIQKVVDDDFYYCRVVDVQDMNNDGNLDVIATAGDPNNRICWWENDGYGNFTRHLVSDSFTWGHTVYAVDLDKDGDEDILGSTWNGNIPFSWFENDGNQNFTEHPLDSNYTQCSCIYAEDINGDSFTDIIGCSFASHTILWWENDGNENFTRHTVVSNFNHVHWVYAEDINEDGNMDILGAAYGSGIIGWFENDGNENFTLYPLSPVYAGATSVYADDVNGDGHIDILATGEYCNRLGWWENNGNETFTHHSIVDTLEGASHVTTGDMDQDLDMDLICAARYENNIVLFENKDASQITDLHLINYSFWGPAGSYHILPGEQGSIEISLSCDTAYGSADDVYLRASVDNASIFFTDDSSYVGSANPGDTVTNSGDLITFEVADTVQTSWVVVNIQVYSNPQSLTDSFSIKFLVGEVPDICVVVADPAGNYLDKYVQPLENLGQISDVYRRYAHEPMDSLILDYEVVIWFSGDAETEVLIAEDIDNLSMYLNEGKKLFITGQNIAEYLQGNPFLSNYLHAGWIDNSFNPACEGLTGSVFEGLKIRTSGGQPSNQISRDILTVENGGTLLFEYLNTSSGAAVGYQGNYQMIFFGFGFESIFEGSIFASPDTIMGRILNWFSVGMEEEILKQPDIQFDLQVNPFFSTEVQISAEIPENHTGIINIYDLAGRKLITLAENLIAGNYQFSWKGRDMNNSSVSSGFYIVQLEAGNFSLSKNIIYIK